jgi:hypothetical protein
VPDVKKYVVKNDSRIWEAETPAQLADILLHILNPDGITNQFIRAWPDRIALWPWQTVRPGPGAPQADHDVENWITDLMRIGWIRTLPKFDAALNVILATFAVFTGLALTTFLAPPNAPPIDIGNLRDWHWWGIFALVALLLRYIIGSAIHLNYVYGGEEPRSISVFLLFKDLLFLVFFGVLAFYIIEAPDAPNFIRRAMLFVLAGFTWSIIDYFARRIWCVCTKYNQGDFFGLKFVDGLFLVIFAALALWAINFFRGQDLNGLLQNSVLIVCAGMLFCLVNLLLPLKSTPTHEWPGRFWRVWTCLDAAQFLATAFLICAVPSAPVGGLTLMRAVAILYVCFLLADMVAMIRAVQSASK